MLHAFKNGQTSIILRAKLLDSSSTTGAGLTGLTSASASLIISTIADNEATATTYTQAGSTIESITTLGTFAAPTATKCRFKEVDSTNHKGIYEFQFADARFAVSSAKSLLVSVLGATNLQQADFVIQLQSDDPFVAKPANYASFSIDASGRVDIGKLLGTAWLTPGTAGTPDVNVKLWNGLTTVALPLIPTVAGRTLDVSAGGEAGLDWANVGSPTTAVDLSGTTIKTTQKVDVDTIKTNPVVNGGTITFPTTATLASTTNITAGTITTATNLTTNNDKTGYSLTAAYDPAKTASQAGDAMALTAGERNSTADAFLNRDLSTGTDSGSTTVRTVRQALRFLRNKWSIAAGTLTVTKEDDATTSWTAAITTTAGDPVSASDPAGP